MYLKKTRHHVIVPICRTLSFKLARLWSKVASGEVSLTWAIPNRALNEWLKERLNLQISAASFDPSWTCLKLYLEALHWIIKGMYVESNLMFCRWRDSWIAISGNPLGVLRCHLTRGGSTSIMSVVSSREPGSQRPRRTVEITVLLTL